MAPMTTNELHIIRVAGQEVKEAEEVKEVKESNDGAGLDGD
ncbi:MAG TPA: hypothetical protein VGR36_08480 [Candidatus Acidoferrales bacterium]|nr:hypothetical protein [Candidatus Acidoferrales bacterium]